MWTGQALRCGGDGMQNASETASGCMVLHTVWTGLWQVCAQLEKFMSFEKESRIERDMTWMIYGLLTRVTVVATGQTELFFLHQWDVGLSDCTACWCTKRMRSGELVTSNGSLDYSGHHFRGTFGVAIGENFQMEHIARSLRNSKMSFWGRAGTTTWLVRFSQASMSDFWGLSAACYEGPHLCAVISSWFL